MSELIDLVNALHRPKLLLQAVRHGLADYNRERMLPRLFQDRAAPTPHRAVSDLLLTEELMDLARRDGEASYSPARHIEVLVALIAEARELASEAARLEREAASSVPVHAALR
ncbi:DUF6477 family protein [Pseudoruegeria sp. HB172150]|uniref:DUF6477 family protein n=1 Tax=Pseudoruegeria sp. HB172150 TaxID=2721164 RepID=UPI001C12E043|nr:DUF6477 family protein [Pseudoruegeria sp. HB172150]